MNYPIRSRRRLHIIVFAVVITIAIAITLPQLIIQYGYKVLTRSLSVLHLRRAYRHVVVMVTPSVVAL